METPQTTTQPLQEQVPQIPVDLIHPTTPKNVVFVNLLIRDILYLESLKDDVKCLTVTNSTRLMNLGVIEDKIDSLESLHKSISEWQADPYHDSDMDGDGIISALCDIHNDIIKKSDEYCDEATTDVRDILDPQRMKSCLLRLHNLYLITELYPQSSIFTSLRVCCVMLMDTIWLVTVAALNDGDPSNDASCVPDERVAFALTHDGFFTTAVTFDHAPPCYRLQFKMHDHQVVFSEEEKQTLRQQEIEKERAEHEAEELHNRVVYAQARAKKITEFVASEECLKRELGQFLDGIENVKDAMQCERVNSLYATLAWIGVSDKSEEERVMCGLLTIADVIDGKDTNVYRRLDKMNPLDIANGMSFFPNVSATNLTSKEEVVLRHEPYEWLPSTVILIAAR